MANSFKDIVITPNIANSADPKIVFNGANATVNATITMYVYPSSNGTISFEGAAGQLFSITNDLSNSIFSATDVSGIPAIEAFANGQVNIAPVYGNTSIGPNSSVIITSNRIAISNSVGLQANASLGTAGQVLTTNGTGVFWSTSSGGGGSVDQNAQYNWTNTHNFTANTITIKDGPIVTIGRLEAYRYGMFYF